METPVPLLSRCLLPRTRSPSRFSEMERQLRLCVPSLFVVLVGETSSERARRAAAGATGRDRNPVTALDLVSEISGALLDSSLIPGKADVRVSRGDRDITCRAQGDRSLSRNQSRGPWAREWAARPGGFLLCSSGLRARALRPGHSGVERGTQRAGWVGGRERCPGAADVLMFGNMWVRPKGGCDTGLVCAVCTSVCSAGPRGSDVQAEPQCLACPRQRLTPPGPSPLLGLSREHG